MAYQCAVVDQSTKQCVEWVSSFDWLDFAITGTQSVQICVAIASYFSVCWVLKKSRSVVK